LFEEVIGFEDFMVTLANSLLKDSIYGTVYRVSVGAVLSTIDAATDIYTIAVYFQSEELVTQARVLLTMITINIGIQLLCVTAQYREKKLTARIREVLITLFFLRPAVDAYRVSTNHKDEDELVESLTWSFVNKGIELATESIPGCVLQLYIWFTKPEEAGNFALASIGFSALMTGFTSTTIAFDMVSFKPTRSGAKRSEVRRKAMNIASSLFFVTTIKRLTNTQTGHRCAAP